MGRTSTWLISTWTRGMESRIDMIYNSCVFSCYVTLAFSFARDVKVGSGCRSCRSCCTSRTRRRDSITRLSRSRSATTHLQRSFTTKPLLCVRVIWNLRRKDAKYLPMKKENPQFSNFFGQVELARRRGRSPADRKNAQKDHSPIPGLDAL